MEGGGIQTAQAFGELAKQDPDRVFRLLAKLDPAKHQRYAGSGVRSIADSSNYDPRHLLSVIRDLNSRGFQSDDFRHEVAWALEKVSDKAKGLPLDTCELLESWLRDEADTAEEVPRGEPPTSEPRSILLNGRGGSLPQGNYPILNALFLGLMQRDPCEPDSWLAVVERHRKRSECPAVWRALANHHLGFLNRANSDRAIAVIDALVANVPRLLHSGSGLRLLATTHIWLPQETISRCIAAWLDGDWPDGPQAAAELAMLRCGLVPSDQRAIELVEAILARPREGPYAPEMRLGVAYLAAELWHHPPAREAGIRVLIKLLPILVPSEAKAWLNIFRAKEPPPIDIFTQQILDAIPNQPEILRHSHAGFLIDQLKGLLEHDREHQRVCKIVSKLMSEHAREVGDVSTAWAASAGDLTDIALTLQRLPSTRACGLDIFESLLDVDAYKISDALRLLDRRLPM